MSKKCYVQGCTLGAIRTFKFPQASVDRTRFLTWLAACGNNTLLNVPPHSLRNRTICIHHFEPKYMLSKKLSSAAVPILCLPEKIDVSAYDFDNFKENDSPNELADCNNNESIQQQVFRSISLNTSEDEQQKTTENILNPPWRKTSDPNFHKDVQNHEQEETDGTNCCIAEPSVEQLPFIHDETHNTGQASVKTTLPTQNNLIDTLESTLRSSETPSNNAADLKRKRAIKDDAMGACAKRSRHIKRRIEGNDVTPLSYFNLSRKTNLSPTDKKLYNAIARLRKTARNAQKSKVCVTEKQRAEKLLRHGSTKLLEEMPETSRNFLMSYFRNMKRDKYSRQYSMRDKVFALALYKRSARAYSFIQEIFSLPSVPTLRKLVKSIPIRPGFCRFLFQAISDKVKRLDDDNSHYCVLLFDETSLDPTLQYNPTTGSIDGLVDNGDEKQPQIANHATVWMLKGVKGNWKQPILYSFCHSTIKWEEIVRTYKAIVREAAKFGLTIISSICDQGATNVRAMKYLIESSKHESFHQGETLRNDIIVIDGQKIVPLFDPPHLVKCVRNNLLTKDVRFTLSDGVERMAKWSHLETAYKIDSSSSLRAMKKLTEYHIDKSKIKKMKVKLCTQVFSYSVASVIDLMSRSGAKSASGELCMPAAGQDTALFLDFMNNLIDSVNGSATHKAMTSTTASDDDWDSYISVLRSMSYVKSKPCDVEKPIVLKNWIHTLQGFKYLKQYLKELCFTEFYTRVFNQDALENFFGQIKQHGMRDTKPNCSSFHAHYKTLLLQSVSQNNSRFNCESDESSSFLVDLENLITAPAVEKEFVLPPPSTRLSVVPYTDFQIDLKVFKESVPRFINVCQTCRENVFGTDNTATGHSRFDDGLSRIAGIMPYYISRFVHIEGFGKVIVEDLTKEDYFAFEHCDHAKELVSLIVSKYVASTIVKYLKIASRILSGSENPDSNLKDTLMLQAHKLYKNRTCRRSVKIEKC